MIGEIAARKKIPRKFLEQILLEMKRHGIVHSRRGKLGGYSLLMPPDKITYKMRAILDWEMAHLGDPLEDLGWVTNPMRRTEHQIPGAWETEQMLDYYAASTGRDVSRARVRWWRVTLYAR